jgi:hypothetical protein
MTQHQRHPHEPNLLKVDEVTRKLWTEAVQLDLIHGTTHYSKAIEEQAMRQKREQSA